MSRDKRKGRLSLRLPLQEMLSSICRCELTGRRRLLIQGCGTILDYGDTCVRLAMQGGEMTEMVIGGEALRCQSYHPDAIVVVGRIARIELIGKEGRCED